jgi:hypothetical protein
MARGEKTVDKENIWFTLGCATHRREYPRNVPAPSWGFFIKELSIEQCPIKGRYKCEQGLVGG